MRLRYGDTMTDRVKDAVAWAILRVHRCPLPHDYGIPIGTGWTCYCGMTWVRRG